MTQNQMVLAHLKKKKPLTPLEAWKLYGIERLASRIHELKKHFPVRRRMVEVKTKHGKAIVAQYYL